jgi:hypothetical protein
MILLFRLLSGAAMSVSGQIMQLRAALVIFVMGSVVVTS